MVPKVETFEHDIADEIRNKEATLAEVTAASVYTSDIMPPKKPPFLAIAISVCLALIVLGFGALGYFYFTDPLLPPSAKSVAVRPEDGPKMTAKMNELSKTLSANIGSFVVGVEKRESGYIITTNNYSAVFGYMTRNENDYIGELFHTLYPSDITTKETSKEALTIVATTSATTTEPTLKQGTTSPIIASSTLATKAVPSSTSTKIVSKKQAQKSTTTPSIATSTPVEQEPLVTIVTNAFTEIPTSYFSDVTISNQNIRVYTYKGRVVAYSFVGDKTIIIATSPDGVLTLKGGILR